MSIHKRKKKQPVGLLSFDQEDNDSISFSKKANPIKPILLNKEKVVNYSLSDLQKLSKDSKVIKESLKEMQISDKEIAQAEIAQEAQQEISLQEIQKIKNTRKRNQEFNYLKIEPEEEEIFEDYNAQKLPFGKRAVEQVQKLARESLMEDFEQAIKESSDEDMLDWEEDMIRKGTKDVQVELGKLNNDFSGKILI